LAKQAQSGLSRGGQPIPEYKEPEEGLPTRKIPLGFKTFGQALDCLDDGLNITRQAWDDPGTNGARQLELILPIHGQIVDRPYIADWALDGSRAPWHPTHEDLLAGDWYVAGVASVV